MAFEFIKRWFPIKPKTFEEFIEALKRNNCMSVEAEAEAREIAPPFSAEAYALYRTKYSVELRSETASGRGIIYKEFCGIVGFIEEFADPEERRIRVIKTLITAEARATEIREKLPEVKTNIIGFDEKTYKVLHRYAREYGINPA